MTFALILRRAIDWFYRRPFSRVISETVFRYGACGAITLSVDAVSYALIYHFLVAGRYFDLGFVVMSPHIASLVLVFPITFFTGFWLNRYVAFRTLPVAAGKQLGRYLLTVVGSILLNYACMKFFGRGVRSVADSFQVYHIARRSSLQLPGGPLLYVQGNFFGKIEGICTRFIGLALRHLARSCRCSQFSGVCSPDFSGNTFVLFVNQV